MVFRNYEKQTLVGSHDASRSCFPVIRAILGEPNAQNASNVYGFRSICGLGHTDQTDCYLYGLLSVCVYPVYSSSIHSPIHVYGSTMEWNLDADVGDADVVRLVSESAILVHTPKM